MLRLNRVPNLELWLRHIRKELFDCHTLGFLTEQDLCDIEEHMPDGTLKPEVNDWEPPRTEEYRKHFDRCNPYAA